MNIYKLVEKCRKFGPKFVLVHKELGQDTVYDNLVEEIHTEFAKQGVSTVLRHQDTYMNEHAEVDRMIDCVLLIHTTMMHKEDDYPKTCLVIGDASHTHNPYGNTEDRYQWQDTQFVNIGSGTKTIMDLTRPDDEKSSWGVAMDISFKKLKPWADKGVLLPIYAGPIHEYAIDKLSTTELVEFIKQKLYDGYSRIMFDDKDEGIFWNRVYKVHSIVKRLQKILPPGSFFFMTSALNAEEIYTKWCKAMGEEELLIMIPCARFESVAKDMMLDNGLQWHYNDLDYEINIMPRPKKFLCYNRMPRLHRVKMFVELHKKGLHNQGLISFHDEDQALSNGRWRKFHMIPHAETHWGATMKYFYTRIMPKLSEFKLNKTEERWNPVDIKEDDFEHFKDTYFSVINETLFYKDDYPYKDLCDISPTDSVFLSEKIFKPLACKHPFIVLGVDKTLENLKRYGYKTFDTWFDESYDQEPDDDKRMDMCVAEIERLINLSDEEWCTMIKEMLPTLQHNFDMLARNKNLIVSNLNLLEIFRNERPY